LGVEIPGGFDGKWINHEGHEGTRRKTVGRELLLRTRMVSAEKGSFDSFGWRLTSLKMTFKKKGIK